MSKLKIHFRPSSHSEDGTIIATFKTQEQAKAAVRKVKHFGARRLNRRVAVTCLNGEYGTIEKSKKILTKLHPVHLKESDDCYQELAIEATFPKGATLETAQLMLNQEDLKILRGLIQECGQPEIVNTKRKTMLRFRHKSCEMLFSKRYDQFWLGYEQVSVTKTFKVKGIF